jgi:hypothetical protein
VDRKNAMIEQHGLSIDNDYNHQQDEEQQQQNGVFAPLDEVNVPRQDKFTCIGRICNEVRH